MSQSARILVGVIALSAFGFVPDALAQSTQAPPYGACVFSHHNLIAGGSVTAGQNDQNNSQNCMHLALEPVGTAEYGWPGAANAGNCTSAAGYKYGQSCGGLLTFSQGSAQSNNISLDCPDIISPSSASWTACGTTSDPTCWKSHTKSINFSYVNRTGRGEVVSQFFSQYPGSTGPLTQIGAFFENSADIPQSGGDEYYNGWPVVEMGQTIPPFNFSSASNFCTSGTSIYGYSAAKRVLFSSTGGSRGGKPSGHISIPIPDARAMQSTQNNIFVVYTKDAEQNNSSAWTQATEDPGRSIMPLRCQGTDPYTSQPYDHYRRSIFSVSVFAASGLNPCYGYSCVTNEIKLGGVGLEYDFWRGGPNYLQGFGNFAGDFSQSFENQGCGMALMDMTIWFVF